MVYKLSSIKLWELENENVINSIYYQKWKCNVTKNNINSNISYKKCGSNCLVKQTLAYLGGGVQRYWPSIKKKVFINVQNTKVIYIYMHVSVTTSLQDIM